MANTKVSDLTAATSIAAADKMYVAQGGTEKSFTRPVFNIVQGAYYAKDYGSGDDEDAIQQAITAAAAAGVTKVRLTPGVWNVATEIVCAENVNLDLNGATLNMTADVNGVRLHRGVWLADGIIDTDDVTTWTKACVLVRGQELYNCEKGGVDNLYIKRLWQETTASGTGDGILFYAYNAASDHIVGITVKDTTIYCLPVGLRLKTSTGTTANTYINCNIFSNLQIVSSVTFIKCETDANYAQVCGNHFDNIQLLWAGDTNVYGVHFNGVVYDNMFNNLSFMDYGLGSGAVYAIYLQTSSAIKNSFHFQGIDSASDCSVVSASNTLANYTIGQPWHVNTECVVNGGFDSDTSWDKGTNWTITGGYATHTSYGSTLEQTGVFDGTHVYQVSFTVSSMTAGSLDVYCGTATVPKFTITANGTYAYIVKPAATYLDFTAQDDFDGHIDNVSAKIIY